MSAGSRRSVFVGRADELEVLAGSWGDAQAGEPRFALVQGNPGVGKTALVEQFLLGAGGARVLRSSGSQPEQGLRFGVLAQLLRAAGEADPAILACESVHEPQSLLG